MAIRCCDCIYFGGFDRVEPKVNLCRVGWFFVDKPCASFISLSEIQKREELRKFNQENRLRIKKDERLSGWFNKAWELYPKKLGKEQALKNFLKTVVSEKDFELLMLSINNYIDYLKTSNTEEQYVKHGSTFFNCWKDWIDYKPRTPEQKKFKELGAL